MRDDRDAAVSRSIACSTAPSPPIRPSLLRQFHPLDAFENRHAQGAP
jgi:hypothetical protein